MGLFKEVKKPVIKAVGVGAEISPLRPAYRPKTPPCIGNCPCGTDIRGWLTTIAQAEAYGRSDEQALEIAWHTITDRNPLPAVCGRVCPHPCEDSCNRNSKDGAVSINALERFVGDYGLERGLKLSRLTEVRQDAKVAIIGAGPAGLSCAYQLARRGYAPTIFEAFSAPGGMLRYGIPRYRLPLPVLEQEIRRILDLGVELRCKATVGHDYSLEQLRSQYQAVFMGIGARNGVRLGLEGEEDRGVFTGIGFLNRVNSGEMVALGRKVLVIGGGDTAIDAARISRRMGSDVTMLYRRTRAEMPAIKPEVDGALEEGVAIEFLTAPVEILRDGGSALGLKCTRMQLGAQDASGRPRPVPMAGTEFTMEASSIIVAIGQEPDAGGFDVETSGTGWIKTDDWGRTAVDGIFAGGDDVQLGLASIAISQGRYAAEAIDARLRACQTAKPELPPPVKAEKLKLGWYKEAQRHDRARLPLEQRTFDAEIEAGLSREEACAETKRCLSCGMCMDCETCWMYCTPSAFVKLPKGDHYKVKLELCNGCKKCGEECPCGYIEMV